MTVGMGGACEPAGGNPRSRRRRRPTARRSLATPPMCFHPVLPPQIRYLNRGAYG